MKDYVEDIDSRGEATLQNAVREYYTYSRIYSSPLLIGEPNISTSFHVLKSGLF